MSYFINLGYFECNCPRVWNGPTCDEFDNSFPGGIGRPVTPPPTTPMTIDKQKEHCILNRCNEKAGNGRCDVSVISKAAFDSLGLV